MTQIYVLIGTMQYKVLFKVKIILKIYVKVNRSRGFGNEKKMKKIF